MGRTKTVKAISAIVAAWALLISVPAAPASAGILDRDRISKMKKDSGWDIP